MSLPFATDSMAPLCLGGVRLSSRVVLAPMSGVTDQPFRTLVKSFGAGLVVSEMIAGEAMVRANVRTLKMAGDCAEEAPMTVQLAGRDPQIMAEAARLNADRGAAIIDINMGCPVKKVVKGDAGCALMRDEVLAGRIIEATVKAVSLPVTVKMRLGWDDSSRNAPRLAQIAEQSGAVAVTVHGRTRSQFYGGHADWRAIAEVKQAVSIPVIGNGDVVTEQDAVQLLQQSQADGVMIGRGTYGRPWFIAQVDHFLRTGKPLPSPTLDVQRQTVLAHYQAMLDHHGEDRGMRLARKHLGWYSKGLRDAAEYRAEIMRLDDPDAVRRAVNRFYDRQLDHRAECAA